SSTAHTTSSKAHRSGPPAASCAARFETGFALTILIFMQPSASSRTEFAADVRAGLTKPGQKELLSKYLYDGLGTALFEAITHLAEYGLTRADTRLLAAHAGDIAQAFNDDVAVAEFG